MCPSSPVCMADGHSLGRVARPPQQPGPSASCHSSLANAKNRLAHMEQAGRLWRGGTQALWGTAAVGQVAGPPPLPCLAVPVPWLGMGAPQRAQCRVIPGAELSPVQRSWWVPVGMVLTAERARSRLVPTQPPTRWWVPWRGLDILVLVSHLHWPGWRSAVPCARWAQPGGAEPGGHSRVGAFPTVPGKQQTQHRGLAVMGRGLWGREEGGRAGGGTLPCSPCVGASASSEPGLVPVGSWRRGGGQAAALMGTGTLMAPRRPS